MGFFEKLVEIGGFEMETAGALSYGRRIWALAKVNQGADIVDGDRVRPYLLLGTSYDGTMATVAKFTSIRAVCNNTVTAALGEKGETIRVLHSERFNADRVRQDLGIVADAWDRFLIQSRRMAGEKISSTDADIFVRELLRPYHSGSLEINETKGYRRIMDLFANRKAIGSDIPGVAGTRWALLNAVTEMVDHERGRSANTRLESAWFGTGAALKSRALELLA
jgi:phage/plasmid-like protein (TIGR03299 family)